MSKCRKRFYAVTGLLVSLAMFFESGAAARAEGKRLLEQMRGGVAAVLTLGAADSGEAVAATAKLLNYDLNVVAEEKQDIKLVMANVTGTLNVRREAGETADKVGQLYKDCGGTILERGDGWTKIQSGNIIGWVSNEFLLFGEDALALARQVGKRVAIVSTETLRVRKEPSTGAGVYGLFPQGEMVEVLREDVDGWVCVDFDGHDGYVSAEFVTLDFVIDAGETVAEVKAREAAEAEAKRHKNYGAYTTDADTMLLLAALIQCEAGGESYEGQVAVGAVVMNRVRSSAYPDTIHGVIYASGQFTPAMTGKLNQVYASGKIYESCIKAAKEALSGVSNVGDMTYFRRNNGREGLVIGNHVFY